MGCHFHLQGIFLTQGLNPGLLHLLQWQAVLYHCATNIHLLFIAALFAIAKTWRLAIAKTWRLPCLSYCRHGCNEHRGACTVLQYSFVQIYAQELDCRIIWQLFFFFFLSDIGNHWKLLSRVVMKSDVCFKRTSLNPPTLLVGMYQ